MLIDLSKFGPTLVSRQAGRESLAAFRPVLNELKESEEIQIDFSKVQVLSPSWADEFITKLQQAYPKQVKLGESDNPSVQATLAILKQIHG